MGATYSEAQKRASEKYTASTDQIRVRTKRGNLAFIKQHAGTMNETLGEFVNRAIKETIYRDRGDEFIETVHSDEYGISGDLLENTNSYYEIDFIENGNRHIVQLDKVSDIPKTFLSDYGWMMLEEKFEDEIMGGD